MKSSVLVSDASVVVDLERGTLLEDLFRLPHRFCVPDLLFKREFTGAFGDRLVSLGLEIVALTPAELSRATIMRRDAKVLSTSDTFAYSLAEARQWTLLTGVGGLRQLAQKEGMPVHDVLWVVEELHRGGLMKGNVLQRALTVIYEHPRCQLTSADVQRILVTLESKA